MQCAHEPGIVARTPPPGRSERALYQLVAARQGEIDRALHNALTLRRGFAHNRGLTLDPLAYAQRFPSSEFRHVLYQCAC
jgi:hypothetical protein